MNIICEKFSAARLIVRRAVYLCVSLLILCSAAVTTVWAEEGATSSPEALLSTEPATALPAAPSVSVPVAGGPAILNDFSPFTLYQHADSIVKAVIFILVVASILSWTLWVGKTWELALYCRRMKKSLALLSGQTFLAPPLDTPAASCSDMANIALCELEQVKDGLQHRSATPHRSDNVKERVHARILRVEAAEVRRLTRGASVLATTSAVAPFIGLFGTVWGIMHSFISIAQSQTTNLSVVAPGIAEALFATALGLVVAIPAVILYNTVGRQISGYRILLADAITLTMCQLSHELERLDDQKHHTLANVG
ncbi:tonB-system energizer ExbB [Pectobacterium araliae]|nr:tonB-system energizer ExbB [Pectobacterium carotovorum subsp. carotovorum]